MDNFRDTFVGQLLRLLTQRKILRYPDEIHPEYYKTAITTDRSLTNTQSLQRWTTTRNSNVLEIEGPGSIRSAERRPLSRSPSDGTTSRPTLNDTEASAPKIEAELDKLETQPDIDTKIVTWINDNDPANPQNWSLFKKCATTGQVCFLTFSVYIGSAIYTAGVVDIEHFFGISEVAAVLGLTVFFLGYGHFSTPPPPQKQTVYILILRRDRSYVYCALR
jgi:MFS transporter, DHA1 family, multidrug resistance protein